MENPVPRVAAIHDLSGFGRASLTVIIPILSTMGIQTCPLPTAVLSTHTGGFKNYHFVDLSNEMNGIITPNFTEAAFLLDEPCPEHIDEETLKQWIIRLCSKGPRQVIISSVPAGEKPNLSSVVAYDREDGRFWKVDCAYIPAYYPGTGDAFASVIVGSLLQGDSLPIALDRSVQFVSMAIRSTFGYKNPSREGVLLEKVLSANQAVCHPASYTAEQGYLSPAETAGKYLAGMAVADDKHSP
ncbi:MAG: bifunctional hydroxymethylpyrimidine kinase/phosphomethylpyrimidine kinase [Thermodesulfobacteriota bacterium]|nr:bifunctional hydroxymethylpyrimidine kinase/phosphomethylpyrimidine kinase [Thermodesulfobacteriota bacterium]